MLYPFEPSLARELETETSSSYSKLPKEYKVPSHIQSQQLPVSLAGEAVTSSEQQLKHKPTIEVSE